METHLGGELQSKPIMVGVSGGADSIALADVLQRAGYELIIAHCNFHLRGAESDRDEAFVRAYADRQGLKIRLTSFDTQAYAAEHKMSIELAARNLRYGWFDQVAREEGCGAIAVAHHQNDQAETVLMNLRRGAGLRGLGGMRAKSENPVVESEIPIIRPLLCTTRQYIRHYLKDIRHIEWVEDSTNTDTSIRRNAIRAEIAGYTEAEIEHIAHTADIMQGYADLMDHQETRAAGICRLYEKLKPYGFNEISKMYDAMQQDEGGKTWESATHRATWQRHQLKIEKK